MLVEPSKRIGGTLWGFHQAWRDRKITFDAKPLCQLFQAEQPSTVKTRQQDKSHRNSYGGHEGEFHFPIWIDKVEASNLIPTQNLFPRVSPAPSSLREKAEDRLHTYINTYYKKKAWHIKHRAATRIQQQPYLMRSPWMRNPCLG